MFYPDSRPGITRRRCGRGFTYFAPDGTRIEDAAERERLKSMAVPPAYENVWMSPRANGHLMATGFDARARKQYRYHPEWAAARAAEKFGDLAEFGAALPRIRRAMARDLSEPPGEARFAHAAALLLIDRLALRVGNPHYVEENGTHGATTLTRRHLHLRDGELHLEFVSKGGARLRRVIRSGRLMRVLQAARDLPGAELFTWHDADGTLHSVGSESLNQYLGEIGGNGDFSAKTFRTWAGSLAAFAHHRAHPDTTIRDMSQAAADVLANTPTVARTSYIHPKVVALVGKEASTPLPEPRSGLSGHETALLDLIG
ncbi:MAG: DNA topoisomerase IB [Pseudooceanicola sp.]